MLRTATRRRLALTRVLIVDDHPITREGLAIRLSREPDMQVCGEASDIPDAITQVAACCPDVAIVDVSLKTGCGIDLTRRIRERCPGLKILVWSMYPDSLYARRALQAGANGYLNKEQAPDMIVTAIRHIMGGGVFLSPEATQTFLRDIGPGKEPLSDPIASFSDRELQVFRFLGKGLSTLQIAEQLHLSPKTVETYRYRLRTKLSVDTGAELLRQAIRWVLDNG